MSPAPRASESSVHTYSEYVKRAKDCSSVYSNQCSTACDASSEPILGDTSSGTSYHRSRLRFSPLPQFMVTNCTSEHLRTSMPLSRHFILTRARSPGFGFPRSDFGPFQEPGPRTSPEIQRAESCTPERALSTRERRDQRGMTLLVSLRLRDDLSLRLATPRNSLARDSIRTWQL